MVVFKTVSHPLGKKKKMKKISTLGRRRNSFFKDGTRGHFCNRREFRRLSAKGFTYINRDKVNLINMTSQYERSPTFGSYKLSHSNQGKEFSG